MLEGRVSFWEYALPSEIALCCVWAHGSRFLNPMLVGTTYRYWPLGVPMFAPMVPFTLALRETEREPGIWSIPVTTPPMCQEKSSELTVRQLQVLLDALALLKPR